MCFIHITSLASMISAFSLNGYKSQEFSDPRDAEDAAYGLNGRDVDGSRIIVEFAKGVS